MKKVYITFVILMAITSIGFSQRNPNAKAIKESQIYCPNLFNPSKFSVEGVNPAKASWQGWVGGNGISGGGGKMGNHASSCGNWDMTFPTGPITADQIDHAYPNSTTAPSTWIFYGNSGACQYGTTTIESHKRFKITWGGMDPLTHNRLRNVPSDPDTIFSSSIRLGNHCGGGQQAEKLIYQFKVQPQNALLVLYYALSLEDARHDAAQNPEFVIEVQEGMPGPNTLISDLNTYNYTPIGDELFYGQPTPIQGGPLAPFMDGGSGTNGSENNVYLPWNKVVINLGKYLNKPIRICIGTGDCAYSVHYAYSYIAGYCRPMKIIVDGCPIDTNNLASSDTSAIVSKLIAPSGLEDTNYTTDPNYKAYQWYICKDPNILGDTIGLMQGNNTEWFDTVFEQIDSAWTNEYATRIKDFQITDTIRDTIIINGRESIRERDTLIAIPKRAFACEMTTYMNKSKNGNIRIYPIKSRLFADASNQKPQLQLEQLASCDGKVILTSNSYSGTPGHMIADSTTWTFYRDSTCIGDSITKLIGNQVTFNTTQAGTYYTRMHVPTIDSLCYAEKIIKIKALENPIAKIAISNTEPCYGDEINLTDTSSNVTNRRWEFSDGSASTDSTIIRAFTLANDTVKLIVQNKYHEILGNDTSNIHICTDTSFKVIHVFTSPELTISDDTIVCEGQQTNVTVTVADNDSNTIYDYAWYRHLNLEGESSIQLGNVLQQIPDENAETCTYYVKVTRQPQGCEAWDSITVHVVKPTLKLIPENGEICPGETVQLIAGNAHHYTWSATPEDMSLIGQENNDTIKVSPSQTTSYTLIGHGSDDCNADPLIKTITLHPTPIPKIEISPKFIDSENPTVTFNDISQYGVTTKWDFGNGNTSTQRQTSYTFPEIGNNEFLTINMTSYNKLGTQSESCYASTSIDIPVQLFSIWTPNTFTPNLTNNNTFKIYTANTLEYFSIQIFDRNGQQLFYSTDQDFEWNGTYNGLLCPQGSYVYLIRYRREGSANIITQKGTVSLIK